MRIDSDATIAGVPVLSIRRFLRIQDDFEWTVDRVRYHFKLSLKAARLLVHELLALNYVEQLPPSRGRRGRWFKRTIAGSGFSLSSAAKPLTRKTADKKLAAFLERVRALNANDYYLYKVSRVVVFGSYLSDKPRPNDIDVAVELTKRDPGDSWGKRSKARTSQAIGSGRRFSNIVSQLFWPHSEVLLFLKSRSRAISLHTTDDAVLEHAVTKEVFRDAPE